MGDSANTPDKSRRWFLSLLNPAEKSAAPKEMVKMLTADGKLVEIEKSVLDAVATKKQSSKKDIYDWMQNPSKEK